jgi:hypothetical protein
MTLLVARDDQPDLPDPRAMGRTVGAGERDALIGPDETVPLVGRARLHHQLAGGVEKEGGPRPGHVVDQAIEQGLEGQPGRLTWGSS